jgi:hypothetical protein
MRGAGAKEKNGACKMIALRLLPLFIVVGVLASCAGTPPLPQAQGSRSTNNALTASIGTEPAPDVKNPKGKHSLPKSKPKPGTVSISATSGKETLYPTTPSVGSPEWEKEKADNERKEQNIKQVIEGICRGC